MGSGGLSEARLGRMHEVMAGHVERGYVPGAVILIDRRGEVRVDAIGSLAFGDGAPIQRDTIFRIASLTKPVTAAAAMILVEKCTLRLDDPVDAWLPELADRRVLRSIDSPLDDTVPGERPITRRDDLANVPGRFGCDGGYGTSAYSDPKEDMVGILMTQRVWDSPSAPGVLLDFWTSAYQSIDD